MIPFGLGLLIGFLVGAASWVFVAAMLESARERDDATDATLSRQFQQGREGSRERHPPQAGQ